MKIEMSHTRKNCCANIKCDKCYKQPTVRKRWQCRIGFHDFHLATDNHYYCRFCECVDLGDMGP